MSLNDADRELYTEIGKSSPLKRRKNVQGRLFATTQIRKLGAALDVEEPFRLDVARKPKERALPKPRGLLSGAELKTGYVPRNDLVDQVLNRSLALLLLVMVMPVFIVLIATVYITSGRPA